VNLRGREPDGIVEPGRDYEALLDQLERISAHWSTSRTNRLRSR
jgi:hypothetical protein